MEVYNSLREINLAFGTTAQPTQLDINVVAIFHSDELIWYVFEFDQNNLTWNEKLTTLTLDGLLKKG